MFDLRQFIFDLNLQQSELSKVLGIAQPQVSDMARGKRALRLEHIAKLRAHYGGAVDKYIIDEESRKLAATMQSYPTSEAPTGQQLNDVIIPTEDACVIEEGQCVVHCPAKLPYVKGELVQSRNVNIRQLVEEQSESLEFRSLRQLLGGEVDYFQKVITAAMMPLFQPGDLLFIRFLPEDAKLISGAIYLVDSKAYGAMVRQVYVDGDVLRLHSLNTDFVELVVHRDEVYGMGLVVRSMRSDFNMPTTLPDIQSMFKEREVQMQRMLEAQDKLICEITEQNKRLERERERQDKLIEKLIDRV